MSLTTVRSDIRVFDMPQMMDRAFECKTSHLIIRKTESLVNVRCLLLPKDGRAASPNLGAGMGSYIRSVEVIKYFSAVFGCVPIVTSLEGLKGVFEKVLLVRCMVSLCMLRRQSRN